MTELKTEFDDLAAHPTVVKSLKAGETVRIGMGRVGNKLLEVVLKPNDAGEYEVSSEWSIFSANSTRKLSGQRMAGGCHWSERLRK
jgi:hypothetical protein